MFLKITGKAKSMTLPVVYWFNSTLKNFKDGLLASFHLEVVNKDTVLTLADSLQLHIECTTENHDLGVACSTVHIDGVVGVRIFPYEQAIGVGSVVEVVVVGEHE